MTKNHFINYFGIFLLAVALMGADGKSGHPLPPTTKDIQKLRYLSGLEDVLPRIFDQPAPFGFDILDVLDQQSKVVDALQKESKFRAHPEHPLLQFSIEQGDNVAIDNEAVKSWKKGLKSSLSGFTKNAAFKTQLDEKLNSLATQMGQGTSQGLRTGLINSLPKDERGAYFKMDPGTQLEKLTAALPSDLSSAGFKGEFYGMPAVGVTKEQALDLLSAKLRNESEFNALLQVKISLENGTGKMPETLAEAKSAIDKISSDQVLSFSNKKELENAIADTQFGKQKTPSWFGDLDRTMKSLVKTGETIPLISKPIRITELPPTVGIFRGYLGGDCSTKYSCGYVWGPDERTFMISGEDGTRKGYMSGTIVKANGKSSYYIHSINGAKISTEETKAVLQGINQAKREMGVSQVIVATKTMGSTINYQVIRDGFTSQALDKEEVELKYQDSYARSKIDPFMSGSYDRVGVNKVGAVVSEDSNYTPVKITLEKNEINFSPKPISRDRAFLLAIDFKNVNQPAIADRMISAMGKSPKTFKATMELMDNPKHLSTEAYLAAVKERFKGWDLDLNDDLMAKKKRWFSVGLMNASDSLEPKNRQRTISGIFDTVMGTQPSPKVNEFIAAHKELILEDTKLWPTVKKLSLEANVQLKSFSEQLGITNQVAEKLPSWLAEAPDAVSKAKVLNAAGQLGTDSVVPLLFNHLADETDAVRSAAQNGIRVMLPARKGEFNPQFYKILKSGDPKIKQEVAQMMVYSQQYNKDDQIFRYVSSLINDGTEESATRANNLLYYVDFNGRPNAKKLIEKMLDSPLAGLRNQGLSKLTQTPEMKADPAFYKRIEKLVADADANVAQSAGYAFPAEKLSEFIRTKKDLKPYVSLVSKVSQVSGPFDPKFFELVNLALDNETNKQSALYAIRNSGTLPPELDAKVRKLLNPENPQLNAVLYGMDQKLTEKDEAMIIGWLKDKQPVAPAAVSQWLQGTNRKFSPAMMKKIENFAFNTAVDSNGTNALIYLYRNHPSDKIKKRAFDYAMNGSTARKTSFVSTWLREPVEPSYGRSEVLDALRKTNVNSANQFFYIEKVWADPAFSEALIGGMKESLSKGPPQNPGLFYNLMNSRAPAGNPQAESLLQLVYSKTPKNWQLHYTRAMVNNVNNVGNQTPKKVRTFALQALTTTQDNEVADVLTALLQKHPFDDPAEMAKSLELLQKTKRIDLLTKMFEKSPPSPEVAVEMLKQASPRIKGTEEFWTVIQRVSDPEDQRFQLALAGTMSKSSPDSLARKQALQIFAEHPAENPEVKAFVEKTVSNPTSKVSLPVNCAAQFNAFLKSI